MPEVIEGKENAIPKNAIEQEKLSIDGFKAIIEGKSSADKKLYEIVLKILDEYNSNSQEENFDRLKRLKATIMSEYAMFFDIIVSVINKNISDASKQTFDSNDINVVDVLKEKISAILDEELGKVKSSVESYKAANDADRLCDDILDALNEVLSSVTNTDEAYDKAIETYKKSYAKVKDENERLRQELKSKIKQFNKIQQQNKLLAKKSVKQVKDIIDKQNKKFSKERTQLKEEVLGDFKAYSNQFQKNLMLFSNIATRHKENLKKYFTAYVALEKAFRFGTFARFLNNINKSFKNLTKRLSHTAIGRGIKRLYTRIKKINKAIFHTFPEAIKNTISSINKKISTGIRRIRFRVKQGIAKIKAALAASKFIKGAMSALGFILGPFAVVGGAMLKIVGVGFDIALTGINIALKGIFKAISAAMSIVAGAAKFAWKHILKPVMKVSTTVLGNALKMASDIALKSFAIFFTTPEGAYTLGYTLGYVWNTVVNMLGTPSEILDNIKEKLREKIEAIKERIKSSKLYKWAEAKYKTGKHALTLLYLSLKKFIIDSYTYLFVEGRVERIMNGFKQVGETFGVAFPALLTVRKYSTISTIASKGFRTLIKGTPWWGKLLAGIILAALTVGSFALGYTQNTSVNPYGGGISIKERYKYLYGIGNPKEDISGKLEGIKNIAKKHKFSPEDIAKLQGLHALVMSEMSSIEKLEESLSKIKSAYDTAFKDYDETNAVHPTSSIGGPNDWHLRLVNMFPNTVRDIFTSAMFGKLKRDVGDNKYVLQKENLNNIGYRNWEFKNDYIYLKSILNFRSRQLDMFLDAFNAVDNDQANGVRRLLDMGKNLSVNFNRDYTNFKDALNAIDFSTNTNIGSSWNDLMEQATSKVELAMGQSGARINILNNKKYLGSMLNLPNEATITSISPPSKMSKEYELNIQLQSEMSRFKNLFTYDFDETTGKISKITINNSIEASLENSIMMCDSALAFIDQFNPVQRIKDFALKLNFKDNVAFFNDFNSNINIAKNKLIEHDTRNYDTTNALTLAQSAIMDAYQKTLKNGLLANNSEEYKKMEEFGSSEFSLDNLTSVINKISETDARIKAKLLLLLERHNIDIGS